MAAYLPQPIIEEILVRLPVKPLVRFRCVCTSWLSLISSSQFTYLHYQRWISNPNCNNHKIIFQNVGDFKTLDYNLAPFGDDSAVKTLTFPHKNLNIVGVCNGLVCLRNISYEQMFIWNPRTGDYKKLSYLSIPYRRSCLYNAGFGYDASTDDYNVLICYWNPDIHDRSFVLYSLKTNSWNIVKQDKVPNYVKLSEQTVIFLNGAFHWINGHMNIMAFELATKFFKEIILPGTIGNCIRGLGILAGQLSYAVFNTLMNCSTIWSLDENGVQVSSTELTTNNKADVPVGKYKCNPLCLTQEGEIIFLDDQIRLLKFNPKTKAIFSKSISTDYYSKTAVYVESLLSPNGLCLTQIENEEGKAPDRRPFLFCGICRTRRLV